VRIEHEYRDRLELDLAQIDVLVLDRPDFLVKLADGTTLAVEVEGQDSQEQQAKRKALDEWVRAVNSDGRFGRWVWDVARQPGDVSAILVKHG
jgi:type III restriction enzyme